MNVRADEPKSAGLDGALAAIVRRFGAASAADQGQVSTR